MVYLKSLLGAHYTIIMGRLIIYCEHIKGFINMVFVVNFHHLMIFFLFFYFFIFFHFDIFSNLLTFFLS